MTRAFSYILLFLHIATTMFIPVADEKDIYDARGRQINDINTLFEFVNHVVLGHTEINEQDEDDDQPHFFTGSNNVSYYITDQQQVIVSHQEPSTNDLAVAYPLLAEHKPFAIAYDILTPPPKV